MDKEILRDLSYGMFVLGTKYRGKQVGCFVNTVVQITSNPATIAVSVNKNNYTNKAIKTSKKFTISILSTKSNPQVIGTFGFTSSKTTDKFAGFNTLLVDNMPVINENICGYLVCKVLQEVSVETHDIIIATIVDAKKLAKLTPMTYSYYHSVIKGSAPKTAPTYIEAEKTTTVAKTAKQTSKTAKSDNKTTKSAEKPAKNKTCNKKYKCIICGHIYDEAKEGVAFDDLPKTWRCPICGVGKENFRQI